jgi:enoyl-CoA hydratase
MGKAMGKAVDQGMDLAREEAPGEAAYLPTTEQVQAWLDRTTLHIRFNNPARHNALSVDMWAAVPPLLRQAREDPRVRLVVFSGAGEKAFVSGADISQFEDQRAAREAVVRYEALAEEALTGIHEFPKPTLACIRGWCIGGGVNVAIACDLRIAATDAVFSIPAARLGLGYRYSAMKNLVDLIGPGAAKDLFFTARRIDAVEAKALGLVSRVCPPEDLPALLAEYTQALADNAPLTVGAGKAITREILKASPDQDRELCASLIRGCFESADYAEGRSAFMQKRKPVFTGR